MKPLSIYIHIPFCGQKCKYCNFYSITNSSNVYSYIDAVKKELKMLSHKFSSHTINTIYFGGGTPSFIDANNIADILMQIKSNYKLSNNTEISIECNPNSLSGEKLKIYLTNGINRFSVGVQSVSDTILKDLGRIHTLNDTSIAIELLKDNGITNINLDFMLGLMGQDKRDTDSFLKIVFDYQIPHISAYSLKVEENTPLYQLVDNGSYKPLNEDKSVDLYEYMHKSLRKYEKNGNKFHRYEISNFAIHGYECHHNLTYWNLGEYLGVGCYAHSFYDDTRFASDVDINSYISTLKQGKLPYTSINKLSKNDISFEYVMLSLRTNRGVNFDVYRQLTGSEFLKIYEKNLEKTLKYFNLFSDKIVLKDEYFYVLNSILVELL